MNQARVARNVAILVFENVEVLDFAGPFEAFIQAQILEQARYVDNGKIVLSAGVSAGIDASLYVIEKILGKERALEAARLMEYDWHYQLRNTHRYWKIFLEYRTFAR
jgi:transcriptional regulator GlxA family with amidase domain